MVVLYVVNFLDRVNVGFAALTMNRDLGFSPAIYGFGAGLFFGRIFSLPNSSQPHSQAHRRAALDFSSSWRVWA
jgi:hypothetical protein